VNAVVTAADMVVKDDAGAPRARLRSTFATAPPQTVEEMADRIEALAAQDAAAREELETRVASRFDALLAIHESLGRLRECATPEALVAAAPDEICRACGFTRVMLSRVRGSSWVPEVLSIVEGADPDADSFQAYVERATIPLAHMLLETELVRRRLPALVKDPPTDNRTFKEIVDVSRSPSYVASPIMPTRRVIGFFHADRFGQDRDVDEADRDNLWIFAEHFGLLFERAVLVERLEEQREQLQATLARAAETIDAMCQADIELVRAEPVTPPPRPGRARSATPRIDGLLTAREREVLDLMAVGATNVAIAQELVISDGTVKSHVKHILRKLRAANRAEAVSRYLHLLHRDQGRSA
jgi:DNA-binding CsgD family transcriptional regulator